MVIKECGKDVAPEQLGDDEQLIGGPLELDSLDALQICLAVVEQYGVRIEGGKDAQGTGLDHHAGADHRRGQSRDLMRRGLTCRPCYFIGAGLHTALGRGLAENLATLAGGLTPPASAIAHFAGRTQQLPYRTLRGAPPAGSDAAGERARLDAVLDATIGSALEQAGLTAAERARAGLFLGTSSFDIGVSEAEYREALLRRPARDTAATGNPAPASASSALRIKARHGLAGPDFSFNTACTASANALLHADAMVRGGRLTYAVVVGVEAFNAITALGFQGLRSCCRRQHALRPGPQRPGARRRPARRWCWDRLTAAPGTFLSTRRRQRRHAQHVGRQPRRSTVALVMQQALRSAGLNR